jgi:hypothetical protein
VEGNDTNLKKQISAASDLLSLPTETYKKGIEENNNWKGRFRNSWLGSGRFNENQI